MKQQHTPASKHSKRVMVVEGDPSLRIGMVNYLTLEGYTATGVSSACDFYRHVFEEPYAVAIIDSDLFDQDGLVVAEYARKNTSMRVITLSASLSSVTLTAKIKAGADLNLVKPVDFRLLAACVTTLFSRIGS